MKLSLLLPAMMLAGTFGWLAVPEPPPPFDPPELVRIDPGPIEWRPFGNFSWQGKASTPEATRVGVPGFEIMKFQVTRAQYAACVADGACAEVPGIGGDLPRTQVNWQDASAFARWYSRRTGETWRLPTEAEWQRAAAERHGDAAPEATDLDPGERMLANYRNGSLLRGQSSPRLRPPGGFGVNSRGVADMAGNVWEWTQGCMQNGTIRAGGSVELTAPYCTVRIAGGLHRAAIIDFVRDPRVGGCAVGLPPDHLGFRLVREP